MYALCKFVSIRRNVSQILADFIKFQIMTRISLFVGLFLCSLLIYRADCGISEKVRLRDVQVVTLVRGKKTAGRRSSPVPQIKCVGGAARGEYEPRTVQCYNRGFDGNDVQWECKAEMSDLYEFGKISVNCEGYDYPDDPYVLQGSCGLEYELEYTTSGRSARQNPAKKGDADSEERHPFTNIVTFLFVAFFLYLAYTVMSAPRPGAEGDRGFGGGGGGGGGYPGAPPFPPPGGPGSGAPPPYDDIGFKSSHTRPMGMGSAAPGQGAGAGLGGGLGGFWTGLGLGGLGGYFMGQRQGQGAQTEGVRQRARTTQFHQDTGFDSSHADRPSTSHERETSGFGGTTRR